MRAYLFAIGTLIVFGSMVGRVSTPAVSETEHPKAQVQQAGDNDAGASVAFDRDNVIERSPDGHFYADVDVNGAQLHMLVDTGASVVALSREDAQIASIATTIGMNDVVGEGADGSVHGEQVTIEHMSLGTTSARSVSAVVLSSGQQSLLGQSFLRNFQSIEIHDDEMTFR